MNLRHRQIQEKIDSDYLAAIEDGKRTPAEIKAFMKKRLGERVCVTGEVTLSFLLDTVAGVECSRIRRRLLHL